MKTIKIFLGSSITELHDERVILGDYLMNSVRPIFKNDGIEVEVLKCEDIRSGNTGTPPQNKIDKLLRECNVYVFMFKTKAGGATIHEFDVARKLQKRKRHEIYVYCFNVRKTKKSQELEDFQDRLIKEPFYWYDCKDITDLESQFILGLLKYERQLLGLTKPSTVTEESKEEKDADAKFAKYQQNEQAQTQLREEIHQNIEDLLQQTKTVMANEDETIAARIFKVIELYKKADQWATATDYDKKKHSRLLSDYADFLNEYGLFKDAEVIYLRQISIAEGLYGKEDKNTAISYNNIGLVYKKLGDYDKALEYYFKDLTINERILGNEHSDIATSYNNIGGVYYSKGNYNKALEYFCKALAIMEKDHGTENPNHASSYNNLGLVYYSKGDYNTALEYYCKALAIMEKNNQTKNPNTATILNNIGGIFDELGRYDTALDYYFNAFAIREELLGMKHPDSAQSYNNIGLTYNKGDRDRGTGYCLA